MLQGGSRQGGGTFCWGYAPKRRYVGRSPETGIVSILFSVQKPLEFFKVLIGELIAKDVSGFAVRPLVEIADGALSLMPVRIGAHGMNTGTGAGLSMCTFDRSSRTSKEWRL